MLNPSKTGMYIPLTSEMGTDVMDVFIGNEMEPSPTASSSHRLPLLEKFNPALQETLLPRTPRANCSPVILSVQKNKKTTPRNENLTPKEECVLCRQYLLSTIFRISSTFRKPHQLWIRERNENEYELLSTTSVVKRDRSFFYLAFTLRNK